MTLKQIRKNQKLLNFEWLEKQIDNVKETSDNLLKAAQKLEDLVIDTLIEKLKNKEWSFIEFLTFVTGLYLVEKLREEKYKKIPGDPLGALIRRPLSLTWIKLAKDKAAKFFNSQSGKFKGFIQNKEIKEITSPIEWLTFTEKRHLCYPVYTNGKPSGQKKLIPLKMQTLVQCAHYNLDIEKAILKNIESPLDLIKTPANYIDKLPPLISYKQLEERWKDKPVNQIQLYCLDNKLSAYLQISEELIISDSLGCFGKHGCFESEHENLFYKKRYKDLEKFKIDNDPWHFDLTTLFSHGRLAVKEPYQPRLREFETTDLEKKFHIYRKIKHHGYKNEITMTDLVFLEAEVKELELKSTPSNNLKKNQNSEKLCKFIEEAEKKANKLAIEFDRRNLPFNKKQLLEFFNNKSARQNVQNLPACTRHTLNKVWKKLPYQCKSGYLNENILFKLFPEVKN